MFPNAFPLFSSKLLRHVFNGFYRVVRWGITILLYNVLRFVSLSEMSYNTINCILWIEAIAIRALLWYLFVLSIVVWIALRWSAIDGWVSRHDRSVFDAIDSDSVFNTMFVGGYGITLRPGD